MEDLESPKDAPLMEPKIGLSPKDADRSRNSRRSSLTQWRRERRDCRSRTRYLGSIQNRLPAYYNRALAKRDKRDFDAALTDFDRAIELKPNDHEFYNEHGMSEAQQRR